MAGKTMLTVLFVLGFGAASAGPARSDEPPACGNAPPGAPCLEPREAVDVRPYEDWDKRLRSNEMVTPLASEVFGDSVSLFNGSTEFAVVDINLPGNGTVPVQLRRRLKIESKKDAHPLGGFGAWDIDVPHIYATFDGLQLWNQGASHTQRCSQMWYPGPVGSFEVSDFWSGIQLHLPGQGDREVVHRGLQEHPRPTLGPYAHNWLTRDHVRLTCTPTLANGYPGEGFIATDADGTRYRFNWGFERYAGRIKRGGNQRFDRRRVYLMATRVEDRHGNWVDYTYEQGSNRLMRISASDGRRIDLSYFPDSAGPHDHRIQTATAHGRTWTYSYHGYLVGSPGSRPIDAVTLPDGSRWTYAYTGSSLIPSYESPDDSFGSGCPRQRPNAQQLQLVVGHPAGATATFAFDYLQHERAGVRANACTGPHGDLGFIRTIADVFDGYSIVSKVVTGPGLAPMAWSYAYPRSCDNRQCGNTARTVVVTHPDQSRVEHVFGTAWANNEGRLLATRTFSDEGVLLQATSNTYVTDVEVGGPPASTPSLPFPRELGANWGSDDPASIRIRPLKSSSITRQGIVYLNATQAFDIHARPLRTLKTGAAGDSKTELVRYRDFIDASADLAWVVGQVEWRADDASCPGLVDGPACRKVEQTGFSPVTGLPVSEHRFGLLMGTRSYWPDGLLHELSDPSGQKITTLADYHRGIPRAVSYRNGPSVLASESAAVSDFGEITRVTGAAGFSTHYAYDAMGRLREITYPGSDLTQWNRTTIQFGPSSTPAFGLPAGHWRHRRFTGAGYTDTYLDGLWRPVMSRTYDQNDEANTRTVVVRRFDHANRETFVSYPQRNIPSVGTQVDGTSTVLDALGRVVESVASSELGPLTTAYAYPVALPGQRAGVEITDPDLYRQFTQYRAYGEPSTNWPVRIARQVTAGPTLDSETTIDRDPWGKPVAITRSGTFEGQAQSLTRRFVYDDFQRLCMRFDPESNWRLQGYDASSNIAWTADGQALGNPSTCQAGNPAQRSLRLYDGRNRLQVVDHPETTGDLHYAYFADGALQTLAVGRWNGSALVEPTSTWTYGYDGRRLLRSEALVADGQSFTIGHAYDGNGHRQQLTYPGGHSMALVPNALGEPTRAGDYATAVAFHPGGAVHRFTYGNAVQHVTEINTRLLPDALTESRFGVPLLNLAYGYDRRGNLLAINDGLVAGDDPDESRSLAYDGLGRMTRADGVAASADGLRIFGQEHYTSDALDNLRLMRYPGVLELRYSYDAPTNRLASLNQFFITPNEGRAHSYGYDARGNITSGIRGGPGFQTRSHVFDAANRMTSATTPAGTEAYRYDGHGRRVAIQRDGQTAFQVYDMSGRLLFEQAGGGATTRHHYLGSRLVASVSSTTGVSYQHTDLLGSPIRKTNSAGTRTSLTVFAPYGSLQRQLPAGSAIQGPGYTGHVTDLASGMVYMQQRYYDPIAMRFLSVDPVHVDAGSGANFNRYWYANNNPYGHVDPDGRTPFNIGAAALGAAAGGIASGGLALLKGGSWGEVAASFTGGALAGGAAGATFGTSSVLRFMGVGVTGGAVGETVTQIGTELDRNGNLSEFSPDTLKIVAVASLGVLGGPFAKLTEMMKDVGLGSIQAVTINEAVTFPFEAVIEQEFQPIKEAQ
jgi:RHS repeat-associated protein